MYFSLAATGTLRALGTFHPHNTQWDSRMSQGLMQMCEASVHPKAKRVGYFEDGVNEYWVKLTQLLD